MEVRGHLTINRFCIMKKILSLIAIAMLTFASCSNEEFTQDAPNNFSTLTATIEQSPSNARIVIGDDNSLAWSEGDAIRVFMKNVDQNNVCQHYDYVYSNGVFIPREQGVEVPSNTTNDGVLGVYSLGADDNGDYYDGSIDENDFKRLNSGFSQNTVIEDGAQNRIILPMWGKWNDGAITFKHLAGVLRINLSDLPADYSLLTITSDQAISGDAHVNDVTVDNAVMEMENYNSPGEHNIITVRFQNARTRTLYVPLPVATYANIKVQVSKYDENLDEGQYKDPIILGSFSNQTVQRGYIYTTSLATPQVSATVPSAVSTALTNNTQETFVLANEIDATAIGAGSIQIPDTKDKTNLNFQVTPKTSQSAPLKFESNSTENSGDATQELDINMPNNATGLYAEFNTPKATATLNGGSYEVVKAKTATNTLIVKEGTTIKKLIIDGGNVRIEGGIVEAVENPNNSIITYVVSDGVQMNSIPTFAKNISLAADITISANTEITSGITFDGNERSVSTNTEDGTAGKGLGVFKLAGGTIKNVFFSSPNTQYDIIVTAGGSVIENCQFLTPSNVWTNSDGTSFYGKRAIFTSTENTTGTLTVNSCMFDDQVYAFNFSKANNKMDISFSNCDLGGWLSGHGNSHTFTNCTFKSSGDYSNYVPYCPATFNDCTFEFGFAISLKKGSTYTFNSNCKYNNEVVITPIYLNWDFSGGTTGTGDNGIDEEVHIGEGYWKNTADEGADEPVWVDCSNDGKGFIPV